jgi:hypothetical protein
MKTKTVLFLVLLAVFAVSNASADIVLFDWAFYIDGATYQFTSGDSMPTSGTLAGGLGTLTWSTNSLGPHRGFAGTLCPSFPCISTLSFFTLFIF